MSGFGGGFGSSSGPGPAGTNGTNATVTFAAVNAALATADASIAVNSQKITGLGVPSASTDADTKGARDTALAGKKEFSFGANAVGTITSATSWMEAGAYAGVGLQSSPRGHIAEVACEIYAATEACGTRDAGGTGNAFYEVFVNGVASGKGLTVALNATAGVGIAMTPVTLGTPIAVPAGAHVACKPYRTGSGTGRSNCTVTYFTRAA